MAEELKAGCARPTGGPVGEKVPERTQDSGSEIKEVINMVQVGRKAPDFSVLGYRQGKFITMKLSDYLGKWVLLFFYPGFYLCLSY
ncbi:MAG: redoxin domain-containing protein [Desulfobulbaceae bacterium]|nr:redoxin domain-containing protein [Desulfobulbaceae bacterium]